MTQTGDMTADTAAREAARRASATQRDAADPRSSAWVAASAGSGKTKVLTDRLLNLLLDGTTPERLLCLTFTKAAAAEMSARLSRILADWSVRDEKSLAADLEGLGGRLPTRERLAKARRLFAEVLDAPGGLKIQTIHAFAQSLLGRFPLEAGVPPGFALADERGAAALLAQAERSVIDVARAGDDSDLAVALSAITDRVAEEPFRDMLRSLLQQRSRLLRTLDETGGVDGFTDRIHATLGTDPRSDDEQVRRRASLEPSFDRAALRAAAEALAEGSKTDGMRADTVNAWLRLPDEQTRADAWEAYTPAFLTATGEVRKTLATKRIAETNPAAIEALVAEAERIQGVEEHRRAQDTALRTCALVRLSAAVIEAYQALKQARAQLDFEDLVEHARSLLTRPGASAWVLFKLDDGLDHILIDEAQDTSPAQWAIVRALADEFFAGQGAHEAREPMKPRTIFAVGDVKQSIYSFQGADPAGFTRARDDFARRVGDAGERFRELSMAVSFRSATPVLEAVDAVFAGAAARAGVAETVRGVEQPVRHQAFRAGAAGRVEVWPLLEPSDESDTDPWSAPVERTGRDEPRGRLARRIADHIRTWIDTGERLPSRDRPIRPGDIMVLVRRRGPFVTNLVRALKTAGVAVAGVDRMVLTEQMAVRDLVALGQALLLPEDDLTLATVLKSPLIGLSEDALFDLCHDRKQERVWHELRRRRDDTPALAHAFRRLVDWGEKARHLAPHDFFHELLATQGGRKRLVARLGRECEDALDEFLAQALAYDRENPPSLQGFLQSVVAADLEVKRELEGSDIDQVRVMTVHGAKGLQAPIVILPDTARPPQLRDLVVWHATGMNEAGLPLWAASAAASDRIAASARADAHRAMEEEYRRLLYVAMTRAEDRLIVCGWRGAQDPPASAWYTMVQAGLSQLDVARPDPATLDPATLDPDGQPDQPTVVLESPQLDPVAELKQVAAPTPPASLPPWATEAAPDEPIPPRPLAPSRPATVEPAVRSPLERDGADRFRRGVLVHRLLQLLPDVEPERRRPLGLGLLQRPVNGIAADVAEAWVDEVMAVLDDAAFASVFAPGSRAEVPITGIVHRAEGPTVVTGRIDRLAVTESEVLIVDFKTNRPPPATIDAIPDMYLRQMATYRALLASLYAGRSVRCALLWTDGPTLMAVPDERLPDIGASP